jgi:hypothetical protein
MRPERMAELVARWVRFYTRDLPTPIAERRIDEIDADLHDHIAHERATGTSDRRIALGIVSRMVRGLAADASWRGQHAKVAHRPTVRIVLAAGLILLVPLVAMQFTDEVAWAPGDFAAAGVLLIGTGLAHRAAARRAGTAAYSVAAGVALAAALLLVWAILAVGLIGDSDDPANLMYGGVLAVGIGGALIARLRPDGMARALVAAALAQALVALIALIAAIGSVWEVLGANAFFVALFIGSAGLFRHAARRPVTAGPDH